MFPLLIDVVDVTGHFLEVAGGLVDQSIESGLLWTTQRGGGGQVDEKFSCRLVHKKLEFQAALLRSQVCSFVAGYNAHFVVAADENFKF